MFKELFQLAKNSPLMMLVSAEGENLRVNVTQKKAASGAPLMLTVVAPPEELDRDFASSIAPAAVGVSDLLPVTDQLRDQLAAAKTTTSGTKVKRTGSAEQTGKAAEPAAEKQPTKTERKQACIDDYIKLAAGDATVTREAFIEKAASSRSFEKLYGNWTKFKAAAERARAKIASEAASGTPAAETAPQSADDNLQLPLDTSAPGDESHVEPDPSSELTAATIGERADTAEPGELIGSAEPTEPATAPPIGALPEEWPFPKTETLPAPPRWTVQLVSGEVLFDASETRHLTPGAHLDHAGTAYVVVEVDETEYSYSVRRKLRSVVIDGSLESIGSDTRDVEPGEELHLNGITYTVLAVDASHIRVIAPPPPPKVRNVVNDEGEKIGTWTENGTPLLEGGMIDVDDKPFTVLSFTEKAIFVEAFVASEVL